MTRNEEARALIDKAWETCSGCRLSWRFKPNTFNHVVDGKTMRCWAIEQRRALQELVKETAK